LGILSQPVPVKLLFLIGKGLPTYQLAGLSSCRLGILSQPAKVKLLLLIGKGLPTYQLNIWQL
jgi:hypothetical protein